MTGSGLLCVFLLVFISDGAFGITTAFTPVGAGFRRGDDLSLESPGPPFGWDVPREGRPMPRWVREAGELPLQPDWDSAATWWMISPAVGESCRQLLWDFAQSSASLVSCVVKNARPVRVCEECTSQFHILWEAFANISKNSGNVSCSKQLLRSDRLQLVLNMNNYLEKIWTDSMCDACLNGNKTAPSVDTLTFRKMLSDSLSCFDHYSLKHTALRNNSDLCVKCKGFYNNLTEWYNSMADKQSLCIDIIDAMNLTQQLWSKTYNCIVPCSDTIPVIAVSTFLLFLPVIFYLSSFLHSEQKKWKLMEPKRLKPCSSTAHIEDRSS
ncbi:osteopetrosis-associated transmembrane protein 1 [Stegostoma tigrinum]|uniref:osteopetrosis-associated transmembrane protein 1 n=1 Tax=Stegostoma tigrinum TaxID=3053191 RepID=UPI00202B2295|nr:osteopetrosis-associated transmembrane protein 1 [Stegostoma tigrinum]